MKQIVITLLCFAATAIRAAAQISERDFVNPPRDARPNTYWEWMNGNVNKEGLTRDLEYMKRANYGAAMIFDAGVGIPRGAVDYNSPQWVDAVVHAMKEAERLDMQLFMHNSPGYSGTGGPWIPVEHSMKQLVWTDAFAASGAEGMIEAVLPRPCSKMGFYRDACVLAYPSLPGEGKAFASLVRKVTLDGKDINKSCFSDHDLQTWYRMEGRQSLLFELSEPFEARAATLYRGEREKPLDPHDGPRDYAPSLLLEVSENGTDFVTVGHFNCPPLRAMDAPGTLSFARIKARYFRITTDRGTNLAEVDFHASPRLENYAAKINCVSTPVSLKENGQRVAADQLIRPDRVIDVTSKMDADGRLRWKAPKGNWTFIRIGYTTTGEVVAAAPDAGVGPDCDKFSKEALDKHFDLFLDPLLEKLKPWCGTTLEGLAVDSWEAGKQNWTENFPVYFKTRRSYDILPYLPAVTGRIVGSVHDTERFLWDFRRTHTDMFLENYVEHFKKRAARYGLTYAGEAYGDGNFESLEMAARQDYPMSEFWTHYIYGNISTTRLASSAGHVWDKQLIACECYTGTPFNSKFTEHPYGMKALGDYIMTAGVNRFVYHATTHQPYVGTQPGNLMTMGPFGTHLDRTSTWANQFAAFNLYNARCAYMLQQGKYVADVLYLKDEAISSGVNDYNTAYPATPFGYRWDIAGTEALHLRLSVKEGRIVLPDGMNYSMMVVTPMERTSPETLERIIELVKQGMTVMLVGDKPVGYPGLDSRKDRKVRELADQLWNPGTLGKGRVYCNGSLSDLLNRQRIQPDFSFAARNKDAQIHFIHRTVNGDEVYFIANHRRRPEHLTVTCRVSGKVPQLWNAETGETGIPVAYGECGGMTKLNLCLQESGSVFVVFRPMDGKKQKQNSYCVSSSSLIEVIPVSACVHTRKGDKDYSPEYDFHSTFTLSLWAKPETFAALGRSYLLFPGAGEGNEAQVGLTMGQNGVRVYERNRSNRVVLEYMKPVEGWTHVALVYKEGIPSLYLNGKHVATGRRSAFNCRPALDVPMAEEQYACSFEGDQTQTEAYDYVLSDRDIIKITTSGLPAPRTEGTVWKDLPDAWTAQFPAWSKAPAEIVLPQLQSLHKHGDFNVKHFSGTVTYIKKFTVTKKELKALKNKRLILNLGRVENMAEVSVNNRGFKLIWKAPYQTDITDQLKAGENKLVLKVTNLYPNRMIGDEHLPEKYKYDKYGRLCKFPDWYLKGENIERERVLFSPWKHYHKEEPLLEAGLLGPVRLLIVE